MCYVIYMLLGYDFRGQNGVKIESFDRVKCVILILEFSVNSSSNYSWEL